MPSLLLHTCCGPCSAYTVEYWRGQGWEVTGLWFNPNIHPFQEHQQRQEAMQSFAQLAKFPLILIPGYDMVGFLRLVVGNEGDRCRLCFRNRLAQTAQLAREKGLKAFSTTLLISPYQKHELLREQAEVIAEEFKIKFLYQDLRSGFVRSRQLSRDLGLYRQQYCGCIYSEWERFAKVTIPSAIHPLEEG